MNVVSIKEASNIIVGLNSQKEDKHISLLASRFRNALIRESSFLSIMDITNGNEIEKNLLVVEWSIINDDNKTIYVGFDLEKGRIVMHMMDPINVGYSYDLDCDSCSISSVKFKEGLNISTAYKGINIRSLNDLGIDILSYSDYETLKSYINEEQIINFLR